MEHLTSQEFLGSANLPSPKRTALLAKGVVGFPPDLLLWVPARILSISSSLASSELPVVCHTA